MGNTKQNRKPPAFDPEGSGYDYEGAKKGWNDRRELNDWTTAFSYR